MSASIDINSKTSRQILGRDWVWWAWIVYWVVLFVITHVPLGGRQIPVRSGDKVIHFLAYFALMLLCGRAALRSGVILTNAWLAQWCVVFVVYGAVDEFLQGYVGRSSSWEDWAADAVGVLAAAILLMGTRRSEPDASEVQT